MSVYTDLSDLAAAANSLAKAAEQINNEVRTLVTAESLVKEVDKIDDEIRNLINEIESYDEEELPRETIAQRLGEIREKLF